MANIFERNSSSSYADVSHPAPPTYGCKSIRRKWIQEKWLISITLLVTSIFFDCAYGDVMCYECAWQGSTPLPSTASGVSDVCRPHNFDVNVVHKLNCPHGCLKQALYEFVNEPSAPNGPGNNGTQTNRTRTISLENMTFFVRRCQQDKRTKESCENKSFNEQVYAEECVCLTDYCNGESSGASSSALFFPLLLGAPALANVRRNNQVTTGNLQLALNRNLFELTAFALVVMNFVPRF